MVFISGCSERSLEKKILSGEKSYDLEYEHNLLIEGRRNAYTFSSTDPINKILPDTILTLEGEIVKVPPSTQPEGER